MAKLGLLLIELAANTARLQSDLGKAVGIAEKAAGKIKNAFKFAGGGLIGAALANTVKQSIQFGDEINKAAIKAGVGGKAMSELAFAAKMADVDIGALSTALKKMQVSLSEAGTGAKGPITALQALGLSVADIQRRRPDAQFELLAQRISQLKDPADRARAATELFGKAGADLLPLFEQGAAGIAKARAEAEKLGLSFSDAQIQRLAAVEDSAKRLSASWRGFATTLTGYVAPALSSVFDRLSGLDTRSTATKIAALEQVVRSGELSGPVTPGSPEDQRRKAAAAELARLRARQEADDIRAAQTGTFGGPQGRRSSGSAIGYAATDAAEKAKAEADAAKKSAEEAAKKRAAVEQKERIERRQRIEDDAKEFVDASLRAQIDAQRKLDEYQREQDERIAKIRHEQQNKLGETAQFLKDTMLQSFEDWIHGGKLKFDELIRYMVVRWAVSGLSKLLDYGMSSKEQGGGGWGSTLLGIGQAVLGAFGGGRAKGGDVQKGKFYKVNENTPNSEWFAPGMNGAVIPAGAFGGGQVVTVAPTYNIDARGATSDLIRALPGIFRARDAELENRIVTRISRQQYPQLRR